jgi:hypothetical protein
MKTTIKKLAFAASSLLTIIIVLCSFAPAKKNSVANGGGVADGIPFSFNAVEQKDGVVTGTIQYGNDIYSINGANWFGKSAILFTDDGHAFLVSDNGKGSVTDWISDPITAEKSPYINASDFHGIHFVSIGNIQVKE